MNIAIVGSGLVGQAWAIVFARGGHRVKMWDGDPSAVGQAARLIEKQVSDLRAAGLIEDAASLISRISGCASLEEVMSGADYVQESLPERLEMKKKFLLGWMRLRHPRRFWPVRHRASLLLRLQRILQDARVA